MKNIPIKNKKLLDQALTHRSWLNENSAEDTKSNERLEFLGDAVLELIISEYLFERFPDYNEGRLTALRASLVRTETLAKVSSSLKLGEKLLLSKGEELGGGRNNNSLLADTFESVVGAIYLDSGKMTAKKFIHKHLVPKLDGILENHLDKDAKSKLQELIQAKGFKAPVYKVVKEEGPDHDKLFTVQVLINNKKTAKGAGKSKQSAQQQAAKAALEKFPLD